MGSCRNIVGILYGSHKGMEMAKAQIKPAAIPRTGYDYQDLVGIEVLIRHYRNPELYAWVILEADDADNRALNDIVAARKDGSYEFVQVKFTVDSDHYELDWGWLLAKAKNGTSMLEKWAKSLAHVAAMGPIHSASLKTNRIPSEEFSKCLDGTRVDLGLLPKDIRKSAEAACGGAAEAETFFRTFDFLGGQLDLDEYENFLRDQLVPTDTDLLGWLVFCHYVRRWATYKNQPEPDGRILREHVVQLITKRRPQPIRQDFFVPDGYIPPNKAFDKSIRERIASDINPITILWGTPGRGKSTYLSYLTQELQKVGAAVARHHYFLSAEDSRSNRISFIEISTSLIDQLYARHAEAMVEVTGGADKLRAAIGIAATNLAGKAQRLYIIIDGLDHVWRDTQRVDQLNHLFNELLPLPPNVSLIVGTQRVPDEQLPGKLLTIATENDWVEIPRMDEIAVHRWVVQQDNARPLILRFNQTPEQRAETIDKIARAFFNISQGHPLHLIYAYQGLINGGRPTSAEEIGQLPPCPDGDIRTYYQGLWVRLSADAKIALHMLAGSEFFWPSLGIRQVLGDFSQIDFLLESRNVGMVPFHSSIFAWVRERVDHAEKYQTLLPKIIKWLADDAPEYWRWGWLWLARAQAGDFKDLLQGATRDWVVESLAKCWPDQQIVNILAAAEAKTFEDGDLPQTIFFRSLKTRTSNAREFQAMDFAAYRATALAVSGNRQQTLNLLDDIHDLTDSEVTELARFGPKVMPSQVLLVCFNELARRVNAWIALRHRPEQEFMKLSDQYLSISALMDEKTVKRALTFVCGFREPKPYVSRLISLLSDAQNIKGLQLVRKMLSGPSWKGHRRLINHELIRAGSFLGADIRELVPLDKEPLSVFAACYFLWRDRDAKMDVHITPIPNDLTRERYSSGVDEDIMSFFYNVFWIAFYAGLCIKGSDYSMIHPGLDKNNLGWLPHGLAKLEEIARDIAEGHRAPTFSAVYAGAKDLKSVQWGPAPEKEYKQYLAFNEALRHIAVDLHFLGLSDPDLGNTKVSASELSIARQSTHWSDEIWVTHNVENRIPLLDKEGAVLLLTDLANDLSAKVTEFSERSERWTQLACMALIYKDGRQTEFLWHAAECLVGYGSHKDLGALDVLDAVVELCERDPAVTLSRLDTLVPIIAMITEFTDGDETNYVRSELIKVVTKIAPAHLPSLYEHYLSTDAHSYADECLIEFAKSMDLKSPESAALARTFLDERTLGVLEDRAINEPAARALLDNQNAFLGRTPKDRSEIEVAKEDLSEQEKEAAKVDPTSYGYKDFATVVKAAGAVHYKNRKEFIAKWLHHWKNNGKASRALRSILSYFETSETTYVAEEILDEAFLVSLAVAGRDAAYLWLVKAHIHRNGWQSYFTSETEIMTRLRLAAMHYPDRWLQYIKDTSVPISYYQRRRYSFVIGYKYLVRFLMLVGQVEIADKITTVFVDSLGEEVREQPIPKTPWFSASSVVPTLSFLLQRLKWPVPMSRWRTAKEVRNLLNDPGTRSLTTDALLDYLDRCKTESEVCAILTIAFLTSPVGRPTLTDLALHLHCPSILADVILERTYGKGIGGWFRAHSGRLPADFESGSYFEEHKTAHVPPIFLDNLKRLERVSGCPFCMQWAYEWKTLADKLGTHYSSYPYYFDDVSETRSGIIGQYWQQMTEVYLSAYLRTLAYAVSEWRMPQKTAEGYCTEVVYGIAGFFDVEPSARPTWLSDFPERICTSGTDFEPLIRELLQATSADGMILVSLNTPVALSVQKFANLTLSVHLVTPDYELPEGAFLYENMLILPIADTFELKRPLAGMTVEEARREGKTGDEVAVCNSLFPIPFGRWQSDYFGVGLRIIAPYTVPNTEIRCTHESIDCVAPDGKIASRTLIWNDDWTPSYPKEGSTRCGTSTMIDQRLLTEAMERLGRKLAFFVRLRIWNREKEYGDYSESKRTFFLRDGEG